MSRKVLTSLIFPDGTIQTSAAHPPGSISMFAGFVAPTGWMMADGLAVSRTTYSNLLGAITAQMTGSTTNASAVVTGLSSTDYLGPGCAVEGTGVPANTTILSVDSATQVTLSANATATGTPTLTFFPHGNGDGSTTFNKPDMRGRIPAGASPKSGGGHSDMWGLGSNDGAALGSRRMKHSHGMGTFAISNESSHTHGTGTYSISGGSHGHNITDTGHGHSLNGLPIYTSAAIPYSMASGGSTTVPNSPSGSLSLNNNTTGISINSATHTHPNTEWSGASGAGSAHTHAFTGSVGTTSSAPSESASYLVVNYIVKY